MPVNESTTPILWDGKTPIFDGEDYFMDSDHLYEMFEQKQNPLPLDEMEFYHCKPNYAPRMGGEYFTKLPEDGEIPEPLVAAMDAFNAALTTYGQPLSWSPDESKPVLLPHDLVAAIEATQAKG